MFYQSCAGFAQVSGADFVSEFYIVHAAVYHQVLIKGLRVEAAAGLGHHLAEDDTGNDGIAREVSLAVKRFFGDAVLGMADSIFIHFHGVDKQHGIPVGEHLLNLFFIHSCTV